jgi:hypothetical protein
MLAKQRGFVVYREILLANPQANMLQQKKTTR